MIMRIGSLALGVCGVFLLIVVAKQSTAEVWGILLLILSFKYWEIANR